ncbi:hypothetical protein ACFV4K_34595 [Nocardia sp. NPDC059764]|uniref:hypothetical protein n=1 Tax=Nocardia sp. NPDC059764 TaxID=3346939 RepID=UPI0036557500
MKLGGPNLSEDITVGDATGVVFDAVDVLLNDSLDAISDEDLVELMRDWETTRRRMAAFEHKLVREIEAASWADARQAGCGRDVGDQRAGDARAACCAGPDLRRPGSAGHVQWR